MKSSVTSASKLAIAISPLNGRSNEIVKGVPVLPLSLEAHMDGLIQGLHITESTLTLSFQDHTYIAEQVNRLWSEFLDRHQHDAVDVYQNHFWRLATPLVYWEYVLKRALDEFKPVVLCIPEGVNSSSQPIQSKESFHQWARYRLTRDLSRSYPHLYLREKSAPPPSHWRQRLPKRTDLALEKWLRIRRFLHSITRKFRDFVSKAREIHDVKEFDVDVVIISQPKKGTALEPVLTGCCTWRRTSVSELLQMPDDPHISNQIAINFRESDSVWDALDTFLDQHQRECQSGEDQINQFVDQPWSVLLTDHQYHPTVRKIIDKSLAVGKSVGYLPEGAQDEMHDLRASRSHFWYYPRPGSTEFLLGERYLPSQDHESAQDFLITGYFGDTKRADSIAEILTRTHFKLIDRSQKTRLLMDLHIGSRPGLAWPHFPSEHEEFRFNLQIINSIDFEHFQLIAKHRYAPTVNLYRKLTAGKDVLYVQNVPWQSLLRHCAVTIVRDSSIGIESLHLGVPVVVYRPRGTSPISDSWSGIPSDVVEIVTEPSEITPAIERLLASPRKDFDRYEAVFASQQHRLAEWVSSRSIKNPSG